MAKTKPQAGKQPRHHQKSPRKKGKAKPRNPAADYVQALDEIAQAREIVNTCLRQSFDAIVAAAQASGVQLPAHYLPAPPAEPTPAPDAAETQTK